ncbi:UNVERIFIED_CONTAM: copper amine oxidase-like protein [Acetivibrio alkalicellulosi]
MKKVILLITIMSFILSVVSVYALENDSESVELKGVVTFNELETGFYELEGYRLVGEDDFSEYENKSVIVKGEIDLSPSIFMTKAIKVSTIELVESDQGDDEKSEIEILIMEVEDQIEELENQLEEAIERYGLESEEVLKMNQDLLNLDRQLINLIYKLERIKEDEGTYNNEPFTLEGYVSYRNIEGGFYELEGFRLVGDLSFEQYAGKIVIAVGIKDISPSIYMTKGFVVEQIEEVDIVEYTDRLLWEIEESINAAEQLEFDMIKYIREFGEDSIEVYKYREELNILRNDAIYLLEKLIKIDGFDVDMRKYARLGSVLEKQTDKISIYVNGIKPEFEEEVAPVIEDGRTLVPFRAVAECMGAEVLWDHQLRKVTVIRGRRIIELFIGDKIAYVDGQPVELDVPAKIIHDRTVLPLRFVSESLDAIVDWIAKGRIIVIQYEHQETDEVIDEEKFGIKFDDSEIKIGDWDDQINLNEMFGEPISEKLEELGEGADTYAGSYLKKIEFDGIVITLMSPPTNGETFFVEKIQITKPEYETLRGVKVGDSLEKIQEIYGELYHDEYNDRYYYNNENFYYIDFELEEGVVKSITIYVEHP